MKNYSCEPLTLSSEPRIQNLADYVKKLHQIKKRAARVARLFFLIQPIESLICGVDVAVAVVIS